jgi:hypothetical protein
MNRMFCKSTFSLFFVTASLMLTGCAALQPVVLDQATAKNVKKIALLPIGESRAIAVTNAGGVSAAFGALGGLVQGSIDENHAKTYLDAINASGIKMADPLSVSLLDGLSKKGIDVVLLTGQHAKLAADGKTVDYSGITTDADVILQVWFGYTGYFSGTMQGYQPWTIVNAKLLDARSKKELYQQSFSAWRKPMQDAIKFIAIDGMVEYGSFDDLMAHFKDSVDALMAGHQAIARQLLQELKLGANGGTTVGSVNVSAPASAPPASPVVQANAVAEIVPVPVNPAPLQSVQETSVLSPVVAVSSVTTATDVSPVSPSKTAPVVQINPVVAPRPTARNSDLQSGISSFTVEKIAKQMSCQAEHGALLVSKISASVEDYRMDCIDGRKLAAHCEYRQCAVTSL